MPNFIQNKENTSPNNAPSIFALDSKPRKMVKARRKANRNAHIVPPVPLFNDTDIVRDGLSDDLKKMGISPDQSSNISGLDMQEDKPSKKRKRSPSKNKQAQKKACLSSQGINKPKASEFLPRSTDIKRPSANFIKERAFNGFGVYFR